MSAALARPLAGNRQVNAVIALDTPDGLKAMVADELCPEPTMEDAFIRLIERQNALLDAVDSAA